MNKAVLVIVSLVFATAGCVGGSRTPSAEPPAKAPPAGDGSAHAPAEGTENAAQKLKFEGTTLDGKAFSGTNLAGKPVVLWFWAPWCPKCVSEGPSVAKAARKHAGKVSFVGIAGLDKSKDQMRQFVSRTGTSAMAHLDDRDGKLYKHFKVTEQSSFLFMKPDGTTSKASGPLGEATLSQRIDKIVG